MSRCHKSLCDSSQSGIIIQAMSPNTTAGYTINSRLSLSLWEQAAKLVWNLNLGWSTAKRRNHATIIWISLKGNQGSNACGWLFAWNYAWWLQRIKSLTYSQAESTKRSNHEQPKAEEMELREDPIKPQRAHSKSCICLHTTTSSIHG